MSDGLGGVITQELKHAPCTIGLPVEEQRAASSQRRDAMIVFCVTLRAVDAIKKRSDIDHFGAMLKKVPIDDGALIERRTGV